jgi:argininosuccinate synthase
LQHILTGAQLFHISYEAGILEDADTTPPDDMWKLTASLEAAPNQAERITLNFTKGIPTSLQAGGKEVTDPVEIFLALNALARKHGIGRVDIVENRFIGIKSRGCYESPGATILRKAHMDLEGLTLDRNVRALRDNFLTTQLSALLYNGFWFSPEREFIMSCLASSQQSVNGVVRLALLKGNVIVEGRSSETSILYDARESSMDELGGFAPSDTTGFIAVRPRDLVDNVTERTHRLRASVCASGARPG